MWFVFSILFLIILAIISNSSITGQNEITNQISIMSCPFPIQEGVYNTTSRNVDHDREINPTTHFLTGNTTSDITKKAGTFFRCYTELNAGQQVPAVTVMPLPYGATCGYIFPCGWFAWVADTILILEQKLTAFFTIISFFITPVNFNIVGYTIGDLSGVASTFVLGIYMFIYLGIAIFIFSAIRGNLS